MRGDTALLGAGYHDLFMGRDTDEAEAAARHMGTTFELVTQFLIKK